MDRRNVSLVTYSRGRGNVSRRRAAGQAKPQGQVHPGHVPGGEDPRGGLPSTCPLSWGRGPHTCSSPRTPTQGSSSGPRHMPEPRVARIRTGGTEPAHCLPFPWPLQGGLARPLEERPPHMSRAPCTATLTQVPPPGLPRQEVPPRTSARWLEAEEGSSQNPCTVPPPTRRHHGWL